MSGLQEGQSIRSRSASHIPARAKAALRGDLRPMSHPVGCNLLQKNVEKQDCNGKKQRKTIFIKIKLKL